MNYQDRNAVHLQLLSLLHFPEVIRAIVTLDRSLTQTIGPDWIERVACTPTTAGTIVDVLGGFLVPDEKGILRTPEAYR